VRGISEDRIKEIRGTAYPADQAAFIVEILVDEIERLAAELARLRGGVEALNRIVREMNSHPGPLPGGEGDAGEPRHEQTIR